MSKQSKSAKPWYKHIWPWVLMAGPIFVVIASVAMFFVAKEHMTDLVSDDYYKDGKHIDIELRRDEEAVKRHIQVQVLVSPDADAAKVFVSGDFDPKAPLNLVLLHPTKKADDQVVALKAASPDNSKMRAEYDAVFKPLPHANHWYVRVEDQAGIWRVEEKWIVSQGNAINLTAMNKLFAPENKASE
ncbi:FixH family protein [Neisseria sp. ZJ106]|uniref:FixH family protein n=1 Tax=Neisseria lisongii TaxID=2912188 RepID=A0AAW5AEG5_9NEIS|nr:FixH family protein [Neisseria lisongii]MCF7522152.1 FixH family protein [Neisseria lisongii]MCF7529440.1 FixH family protein [Neisseria lisongii]WCL72454.1 FixH family protein [Neisseria lisongii]